jgi:hypothetical protein
MKKVEEPMYIVVRNYKLYYEGFEQIYNIIKSNTETQKMLVDGYELESIEEFKDNRFVKPKSVEIYGHNPYYSIKFERYQASLYSENDHYQAIGIINEIKNIVCKYSKILKVREVLFNISWTLLFVFSLLTLLLRESTIALRISTAAMIANLTFYTYLLFSKDRNRIHNFIKDNQSCFWRRNKDQLLLAFITGLIGLLIQLVVIIFSSKS